MPSLSDTLLNDGLIPLVEQVHGEQIKVLTGLSAGKLFTGVIEIEQDVQFETELDNDPRGKRMVRFTNRPGNVPQLVKLDRIQTSDGKQFAVVRQPDTSYLTVDYEIVQIDLKNDT
jgi:hypothetical protein